MMIRISTKAIVIICLLISVTGIKQSFAQKEAKGDTVAVTLTPHSKDALFSSTASFTVDLNSSFATRQTGKLSYVVTTEANKQLKTDSVHVIIGKGATGSYNFDIAGLKTGFYKIRFMLNVTDYDDTVRRAFGIRADELKSAFAKPDDFDSFWLNTKKELDKINPEFKVTPLPDSSRDNRNVFLVEMKSLGGLTVRGFLTEPKTKNKNKKFVVLLGLPGYQMSLKPMFGTDPDIAIFTLNIRGSGNSRDVISVRRETYITLNLEDKNRYILRGAIMDCVRAVDFIYSRPELRHDNIIAAGGSLGGYLCLATSAVDKRINFCSAANPILCDIRNLPAEVDWPFVDIKRYVDTRPGLTFDGMLNTLDYFDGKNFATNIKCPTLVGLGLVDNIAPPNHVYTMYNNIPSNKHIIVFKDLGHEIGVKYEVYEGRWMRDQFALF